MSLDVIDSQLRIRSALQNTYRQESEAEAIARWDRGGTSGEYVFLKLLLLEFFFLEKLIVTNTEQARRRNLDFLLHIYDVIFLNL